MKSKLSVDFVTSEELSGALNQQQRAAKTSSSRESLAPKIVVCPPMEEIPEPALAVPRGASLLKALSRRLSRRSADGDSLGSSSSSDSVSDQRADDRSSCSASDSGSDGSERHRRNRSTVSLRRIFQSLSLSRSQSCSPTDRQRQSKKQQQPKRILRPPVTYTYVRGLSGLPTQRVPRHTICCSSMGLNR